jgi:hypothetical protein
MEKLSNEEILLTYIEMVYNLLGERGLDKDNINEVRSNLCQSFTIIDNELALKASFLKQLLIRKGFRTTKNNRLDNLIIGLLTTNKFKLFNHARDLAIIFSKLSKEQYFELINCHENKAVEVDHIGLLQLKELRDDYPEDYFSKGSLPS